MAEELIEQLDDKGVLSLVLNRPERKNAMNQAMLDALVAALLRASTDFAVRCVLLSGAGGAFCAGGDVKAFASGGQDPPLEERAALLRARMEAARLLHEMPKPTVAMIEGAAAGAGLSIALACDLRIVGANAKLTTAFAKVGLSGDFGGTFFMTQLVGAGKARELYLTSPIISGEEAGRIGLVTRVVPDADVQREGRALATSLAQGPTVTLGYMKKNLLLAEDATLETVLDAEALHHSRCSQTADHKEASRAFVEKRPPVFAGR
jgi:2-(1,2-epoxy-1,2-dihydrophenyl)acetyl-CoA isomerase